MFQWPLVRERVKRFQLLPLLQRNKLCVILHCSCSSGVEKAPLGVLEQLQSGPQFVQDFLLLLYTVQSAC